MQRTVDHYVYSDFKILKVADGDRPGESYAQLQYCLMDKRTPQLDANGKKVKRAVIENGQFVRVRESFFGWGFAVVVLSSCRASSSRKGAAVCFRPTHGSKKTQH